MALTERQITKIGLFNSGIRVSTDARFAIEGREKKPISTSDYASTSGVALDLGDDIFANAPIVDNNPNVVNEQNTPYELDYQHGRFYVVNSDRALETRYIPVPSYLDKTNSNGVAYRELAVTHIDRVRISPVEGCAIACQFCNIPYELKYQKHDPDDLVDSVRVAIEDPILPAQHVLISGGTPKKEDFAYENNVYEKVTRSFPGLDVDIMMAPVDNLLDPKYLSEIGIHGLSINLELYNTEIAKQKARGKYDIGRDNYLQFIADCVDVFGPGKVRSLLMVGIEPLEDTLKGVRVLAERGCDPVLSPFIPDPATPLRNEKLPSIETQMNAYIEAREIVSKYPDVVIGPRCIPCQHNTLAFPDSEGKDSGVYYRHFYSLKP